MKRLSGKKIAEEILSELRPEIEKLILNNIIPTLAVVLVGDDPASAVYVGHKKTACKSLGIRSLEFILPANTTQEDLENIIIELNEDSTVHGILCQFPLPKHLNEASIIDLINPKKDVDCFHPYNLGRLASDNPTFMPVTPYGIFQILKRSGVDPRGKHVVIIGRGTTVGRPLSIMMSLKGWDSTVTLCHSHTKEIRTICRSADILVGAIGRPKFITRDFLKQGVTVIDVGINKVVDTNHPKGGHLVGDVDYKNISDIASAATPVPGGVGPVTISILMFNCINAARIASGLPVLDM
ncbi:MAG: bifunctional 5,10-methylenetetrahydrofolate dehydrogenase/5,10-methenyltetrahydrofolate cyclohydrolase [Bacteriovoracaceae bacterium]|nr:bifunctional 5,10-methylenetetrahydrofolate dehydrogenase/5,10-methenyltetrahydrofolate cyclohydrolase [Bacteriovoracaceae bacterium]